MPPPAIPTSALRQIDLDSRRLTEPANFFSGAKIDETLLADNIVVFKRTSSEMLKPHGVTHSYHHRFVLLVPLVAAGRVHLDGLSCSVAPGRALVIFPHQFHRYFDLADRRINWLFITFEGRRPELLASLRNTVRRLSTADAVFLDRLMRDHVSRGGTPAGSRALLAHLSEMLERLLAALPISEAVAPEMGSEKKTDGIVPAINRYVRAHLDRSLTIADLANHTGYSVSHLRAVFRSEFGVSLGSYMRHSRLSVAAAMLSRPDRPSIEKIASACGFESIFAFSRAFKRAMGLSPRAYGAFLQAGGRLGRQTRGR